jgi:hypothetical protein
VLRFWPALIPAPPLAPALPRSLPCAEAPFTVAAVNKIAAVAAKMVFLSSFQNTPFLQSTQKLPTPFNIQVLKSAKVRQTSIGFSASRQMEQVTTVDLSTLGTFHQVRIGRLDILCP